VDDIIRGAQRGDRDALGELWRSHQHLVLRYLRGRGAESPEDLASQVWIDVANGLHRFQGDEHDFRRWLFTIARRRYIDELRRSSRHPRASVDLAGDGIVDRVIDRVVDQGAEAELGLGAALEQVLAMVRRLPDDMAEAVLLRVVADLDVGRVAEIMGRREGHVRVLVHRGLAKLADQIVVTNEAGQTMNTT
jgi:RNA polymerase sigma-70 factor, ECF subfamily